MERLTEPTYIQCRPLEGLSNINLSSNTSRFPREPCLLFSFYHHHHHHHHHHPALRERMLPTYIYYYEKTDLE